MKQIQFAQTYNNEAAHRQVKLLMKQHKQLYIQVNGEAWISSQGVTSIRYQLNAQGWQWILNYLQTGDYEDFGVFPSVTIQAMQRVPRGCGKRTNRTEIQYCKNPFLRETEAYIRLRGLFRFGKLFFSIRRSDEFIDYLNSKGL